MKYIDEYRDRKIVGALADEIREAAAGRSYSFMEVCGTHTMNIFRFGLKELLPPCIRLISGPGCPVCVTPNSYLDKAIALAARDDFIIATFGDMLRVPGSRSSLEKEKARGGAVRIVYSSMDALEIARRHPDNEIVFLGIGFETTVPTVAQSILTAKKTGVANYSVLSGHKTMPEVMDALLKDGTVRVDGFLLPGHVSAVIGSRPYGFLARRYKKRCVIAGFEPADILQAVLMLIRQKRPAVEIQYKRIVEDLGNPLAMRAMKEVFRSADSSWRGMGIVKKSGLVIRKEFSSFDAERKFDIKIRPPKEDKRCICGLVLKALAAPGDCKLFGRQCTPEHPVGACMVSGEGTCAAHYKYSFK